MNYTLTIRNGKVNYLMRQKYCTVCSSIMKDTAESMLAQGNPKKSDQFKNYPISVEYAGNEYFFEGVWPAEKKNKKRKADNFVCGNDYCEIGE